MATAVREAGSPDSAPLRESFSHRAERFADVRILRYQVRGFDALTLRQKTFAYYLQEAALSGRDITYDQKFAHNLLVRRTLETVVSYIQKDNAAPPMAAQALPALLTYLKRVWFSNGIHHHVSNQKLVPEGLDAETFAGLVRAVDSKALPLKDGESVEALIAKLTPIIFDPTVHARASSKEEAGDPVRDSANHFYVNLTKPAVLAYTSAQRREGDATPVSHGLNSQLVRKKDGSIEERTWRVGGMYGAALAECVRWLELAIPLAEDDAQAESLRRLVAFYRSGNLADFDRYSIAWVKDTESSVDLIHGFIETYGDPLDLRGTFEALVMLNDVDATKRIHALSSHAQWFEDHSPIPKAFKKENVVGINARVVQAVLAAGDTAPSLPSGVNLPNSNWIREAHGSKSVTLGNILDAYEESERDSGVLEEFAHSAREVERARAHGAMAKALLVDMHEVIGHASGKVREGTGDVSSTLLHYGSTLEEARADLVALYYILDPKLIELKLVPSHEVGRAAYDGFLRGALVQLARIPLGQQLEEAHMRNRQLITRWTMQEDAAENILEKLERGGKTFVVVRDYPKLRQLFGRLLAEIQRIKSEGDFEAARDLVEAHGVRVDPLLHRQVLTRYQALRVAPYAGFMQPSLVPVRNGDEIVDVRIEYPTDFATQQLEYSAKYAFLPTYN